MGDATIIAGKWRLVQVGRVVLLQAGQDAGKLAVIVEVIDHKRALVDGPSSVEGMDVPRQPISLSTCMLSQMSVEGLQRGMRRGQVKELWEKSEIDSKWTQTNWAKTREQQSRRRGLSDFDRFKVMRLKKQRRFEQRKALAKVKAAA